MFIGTPIPCQERLGVENGDLVDSQLTVSSDLLGATAISHWRLNQPAGAGIPGGWVPTSNDTEPWLQVTLYRKTIVAGVAVQGRDDEDMWVTTYKVNTSTDGSVWNAALIRVDEEVCSLAV